MKRSRSCSSTESADETFWDNGNDYYSYRDLNVVSQAASWINDDWTEGEANDWIADRMVENRVYYPNPLLQGLCEYPMIVALVFRFLVIAHTITPGATKYLKRMTTSLDQFLPGDVWVAMLNDQHSDVFDWGDDDSYLIQTENMRLEHNLKCIRQYGAQTHYKANPINAFMITLDIAGEGVVEIMEEVD